jgi:hypothetical protein
MPLDRAFAILGRSSRLKPRTRTTGSMPGHLRDPCKPEPESNPNRESGSGDWAETLVSRSIVLCDFG